MTVLYVDGDACPVREEVYRVAERRGLAVFVVANGSRPMRPSGRPGVSLILVPEGPDAADDWIAERIGPGDICITADIPLASRCLERGGRALSPRGHVWTTDNIGSALAGRAVAEHLRSMGVDTRGPASLTKEHRSRFLAALDAEITAAGRPAARRFVVPPGGF
ncbi:YaiI/YqxD family protein [Acidisoma sp. C75]